MDDWSSIPVSQGRQDLSGNHVGAEPQLQPLAPQGSEDNNCKHLITSDNNDLENYDLTLQFSGDLFVGNYCNRSCNTAHLANRLLSPISPIARGTPVVSHSYNQHTLVFDRIQNIERETSKGASAYARAYLRSDLWVVSDAFAQSLDFSNEISTEPR